MKESTKTIIKFLQANADKDMTAADVAEALGLEKKSVDGTFTAALQRKGYGYREEVEVEVEEGKHAKVKFLKLTESGVAYDVDATEDK